jgi:hypothetical protein
MLPVGQRESVASGGEAGRGFAVPAAVREEQSPLLSVEPVGQLHDRTAVLGALGFYIDEVGAAREHGSVPQFDDGDSEAHPFFGQVDTAMHERRPVLQMGAGVAWVSVRAVIRHARRRRQ